MTIGLVAAAGTAALGADGSLPGGTSLSVDINEPADGLTIEVDDEDDTADVTVTGSASLAGTDATKNTTLIYILDVSGSMNSGAGVDCNENGRNDSRRICQARAVAHVNALAADPGSPVGFTGVGTYGRTGAVLNLDRADGAERFLVEPAYDGDGSGTPDVEEVVAALSTNQSATNFSAGLDQALKLLKDTTTPVARIIFISDGGPNAGADVNTYAENFKASGLPGTVRIDSFAIATGGSSNVGCDNAGSLDRYGSLDDIAKLGTDTGTCTEVEDLSDLNFVLGQVLSSELLALEGSVSGGDAQTIDDVTPDLPAEGPVTADFSWDVTGLGVGQHELCVTATGVDGGGEGDVTECVTVTVEVLSEGTYPPEPTPEPEETEVLDEVIETEVRGEVIVSDEAAPAEPVSAEPDFTG